MAGVSTRTLRYYNEIGLLKPAWRACLSRMSASKRITTLRVRGQPRICALRFDSNLYGRTRMSANSECNFNWQMEVYIGGRIDS